ncbi:hypothetical protein ACFC1I_01020 [Microbacterium sp. NPDC056044]|uniref:hypothetical protein n=1 Tax=Microbacterium sp. NPDC056044 TaxID=3345690 RepID=UPI0035D996AD
MLMVLRTAPNNSDDRGVALVAIVVIMLVGVVAAILIASSVMFALTSNATNRQRTQAFIAAESGRDQALSNALATTCTLSATNLKTTPGAIPPYYEARTDICPSATDSTTFVVTSTGYGSDGTRSKITSTYSRLVTYTNQPGGSLAYIDGTFTLTQSQYSGDVVIRTGNYDCSTSHSTINGDLWVLQGSAILSSSCTVMGSVYTRDDVTFGSSDVTVGGRIIAGRDVTVSTNKFSIGKSLVAPAVGDVLAGRNIDFTGAKSGEITGSVRAFGTYKPGSSVTIAGTAGGSVSPNPAVFTPTLDQVEKMTRWVDINADVSLWGSDVQWYSVPNGSCAMDVTSYLTTAPAAGKARIGVDYSACTSDVTIKVNRTGALSYDTVFIVPPAVKMALNLTGAPTSPTGRTTQLFIVHADANPNSVPNCVSGADEDDIKVPSSTGVNLMFYTPCGVGKLTGSMNPFNGQFYAGNSGSVNWVQPVFTCKSMAWAPLIDLGCKLGETEGTGSGTIVVTKQPAVLITQVED